MASVVSLVFYSQGAIAGPPGWYWGIGYHNPTNAAIGLNFSRFWPRWVFEFGIGYMDSTSATNCSNSADTESVKCYFKNASSSRANLEVAGGVNFKYLLGRDNIRPYIQLGSHAGLAIQSGPHLKIGGALGSGFGGVGFFIMGNSTDFYLSYLFVGSGLLQFGFNF